MILILAFGALTAASTWAVPPLQPEYGLCGLRRVQLVFADVTKGPSVVAGVMPGNSAGEAWVVPDPRAAVDTGRGLAERAECQAIGPSLSRAGIEIVERCRDDDAACGKLYLTMESYAVGNGEGRAYMVGIALTQPLQLERDPERELSAATTWSEHRFGLVRADHSATITSCMSLQDLAHWFSSLWQVANK
jgi:hypothetical protein